MTAFVPPQAPAELHAVYELFSARYSASGLRLNDFPGRCIALRGDQAVNPQALPLLDEEVQDEGPGALDAFMQQARAQCPAELPITYVLIERREVHRPRRGEEGHSQILSIEVQSSEHAVGLLGFVSLDDHGAPVSAGKAIPLLLNVHLQG